MNDNPQKPSKPPHISDHLELTASLMEAVWAAAFVHMLGHHGSRSSRAFELADQALEILMAGRE
jgi:hypothetical protein